MRNTQAQSPRVWEYDVEPSSEEQLSPDQKEAILRQQEVLAQFGEMVLRNDDLDAILTEACRLVGQALGTDLSKVMELQEDGRTLLVRAGVGWRPGIVGHVTVQADKGSSEGHALQTGEPVLSTDIEQERRFDYADFIKEHGVRALVNVIILGGPGNSPFGLLQVDSRRPRNFDDSDINFLRGYANLLGAAVERLRNLAQRDQAEGLLRASEGQLQTLISGIPQMVWKANGSGDWTWASPQWAAMTGQSEPDSHGDGWLACVHPHDRAHALAKWAQAQDAGQYEADYRLWDASTESYRWFQTRATPVRDPNGTIVEWLGTSTDVDDLRLMRDRQQVLITELQHRTFNLLGTVRSMADATLRASEDLSDFKVKFRDRIDAMARVQLLLSRLGEKDRVTFDELIQSEIAASGIAESDAARIILDGPAGVSLQSRAVQTFAMAIHELMTNALKHGALKQSGARLAIRWHVGTEAAGGSWLYVDWQEHGVDMRPGDAQRRGTGQGRTLIERALPYQLGARTTYELASDGVRCTIALPMTRQSSPRGAAGNA